MNNVLAKIGISSTTAIVLTESLNLDLLWNALITLAVSVITVLSIEGVNLLKKYIAKKSKELDEEDKKEE